MRDSTDNQALQAEGLRGVWCPPLARSLANEMVLLNLDIPTGCIMGNAMDIREDGGVVTHEYRVIKKSTLCSGTDEFHKNMKLRRAIQS